MGEVLRRPKVTPGSGGRVETRRSARTSSDRGVELEGCARGRRQRSLVGRAPVSGVSPHLFGGRALFREMLTRLRFPGAVSRKRRELILAHAPRANPESRSRELDFKSGTPHRLSLREGVRSWSAPLARGHTRPRSRWHPPLRNMIRSSRWSSAASSARVSATFVRTLEVRLAPCLTPHFFSPSGPRPRSPSVCVGTPPDPPRRPPPRPAERKDLLIDPKSNALAETVARSDELFAKGARGAAREPEHARRDSASRRMSFQTSPSATSAPARAPASRLEPRPNQEPKLELTRSPRPPSRSLRRSQSSAPASSTRTPSPTSRSSVPRWRWRSASAPAAPPRITPASFAVDSAASS